MPGSSEKLDRQEGSFYFLLCSPLQVLDNPLLSDVPQFLQGQEHFGLKKVWHPTLHFLKDTIPFHYLKALRRYSPAFSTDHQSSFPSSQISRHRHFHQ